MKKVLVVLSSVLVLILVGCGSEVETDYPHYDSENDGEVTFDESILEDFLSEFLTIFENNIGWKDTTTGIVYASVMMEEGERLWFELQPVEEFPLITLGGERQDFEYFDFHTIHFDGVTILNQDGELITEAPFIYPRMYPYGVPGLAW